MYFVYILANRGRTLYVGVTRDLPRRVYEHRSGVGSRFTAKYGIHRLVWFEGTANVAAAIAREKQIKGWNRQRKVALIEERNAAWGDLAVELGIAEADGAGGVAAGVYGPG